MQLELQVDEQPRIAVSRRQHSELNIVYLFDILRIRPFLSVQIIFIDTEARIRVDAESKNIPLV